ncbi:cytidylyltransferase domain-containing protein [Bdellovibrio sp. HCB337]|uniref:acylneuraminate cytidylyltransferase family protein n=1 Tax=Bdellovibrio sp. HCB337 TaxID=3394358 RepID=UPI0039A53019
MKKGLAIIPARAGSKRIPGKNKRPFLGKPLIQWTIEAALNSPIPLDVVVSTDDPDILKYKDLYPSVDFLSRSAELAQDTSSSSDVIVEVMKTRKQAADFIVLLQPTSPLRGAQVVGAAVQEFLSSSVPQMVSVRACREVPSHIFYETSEGTLTPLLKNQVELRSQDWKNVWTLNGALYLSDWDLFLKSKSFFGAQTKAFVMAENLSVDIDTEEDWKRAETFAQGLKL